MIPDLNSNGDVNFMFIILWRTRASRAALWRVAVDAHVGLVLVKNLQSVDLNLIAAFHVAQMTGNPDF